MEAPPSYEASQMGFQAPKGSAPPPASYSQPSMPSSVPVVVQYVNVPSFGPHPAQMTCPHCAAQIITATDSEPGPMAWVLGGILCFVGLWPCACIPCCIESLNSVTHKCPNCRAYLGRYKGGL